jgi:hypothetical protein
MEFSRKELEDIQRVAGLLNLSVDELLQQSRERTHKTTPAESPRQQPQHRISQQRPSFSVAAEASPVRSLTIQDGDFDLLDFELPQPGSAGTDPARPSPRQPAERSGTDVILLNPHSPWYDCDAALFGFDDSLGDTLGLDESNLPAADAASSYIPASAMQIDSSSVSGQTAQEESQGDGLDDASTDWALVSPPESLAFHTSASPSTASKDKRYHVIVPRSSKSTSQSASENSSYRVKKKRSPYEGSKKTDTHLTRQLHACVRCRMQRNRVSCQPLQPSALNNLLTTA